MSRQQSEEGKTVRAADAGAKPQPEPHSVKDCVDLASEDSFPASDAPSWIGVTGTGQPHLPLSL